MGHKIRWSIFKLMIWFPVRKPQAAWIVGRDRRGENNSRAQREIPKIRLSGRSTLCSAGQGSCFLLNSRHRCSGSTGKFGDFFSPQLVKSQTNPKHKYKHLGNCISAINLPLLKYILFVCLSECKPQGKNCVFLMSPAAPSMLSKLRQW